MTSELFISVKKPPLLTCWKCMVVFTLHDAWHLEYRQWFRLKIKLHTVSAMSEIFHFVASKLTHFSILFFYKKRSFFFGDTFRFMLWSVWASLRHFKIYLCSKMLLVNHRGLKTYWSKPSAALDTQLMQLKHCDGE